uniref:Uncharacterized protein n=1 Tax=Biomphalaria glabrata TaxID=6526 RepID=A0A2C9L8K0_BIOGL
MGNRFVATTIIHGQQRVVKFKQNLSYLTGMGSQLTISAKGPASKEQRNLEFISMASKKSMSKETAIQSKAHSRVDVSIMRSADNLEAGNRFYWSHECFVSTKLMNTNLKI